MKGLFRQEVHEVNLRGVSYPVPVEIGQAASGLYIPGGHHHAQHDPQGETPLQVLLREVWVEMHYWFGADQEKTW